MIPVRLILPSTLDDMPKTNTLNSYWPLRNNKNEFNWDVVVGLFLGAACRQQIQGYSQDELIADCRKAFEDKLDDVDFWNILEQMYFENGAFYKIAPECLLFRAQKTNIKAADVRIASMYLGLLNGVDLSNYLCSEVNFIEQQIVDVLRKKITPGLISSGEYPYLPFLSECFQKDLLFLSSKPKYMLGEFKNFLSFYGFLYCSQLALNLPEWRKGAPKSKPLYFIMDNEKASSERTEIQRYGWRSFHEAANTLFPLLSMLENLQLEDKKSVRYPLWYMAESLKDHKDAYLYRDSIKKFALAFKEQRNLSTEMKQSNDVLDWLDNLQKLAVAQFGKDLTDSSRYDVNRKYVNELVELICGGFVQSRGRAGRVLVINQDNLILLTNISIGNNDKLRFHELVRAFENRGVYLDKQTQQKLIEFYERIGNVERMSDSGDAVYVRKTI
ncbi:DNA phosphorothioation-dependent restriction protein DptG [Geobacter sp. SVR]|uniref:DNA phosphorothioation-dependent restriction protein DptG n=1 Tax=Geobacter sp. SVR TaxID=2495594 RepID=UPI00143EFAC8|nr:DNA phosphorothioation-dependent restriction protein DptG [Geobacter sp. SVR]BCS52637.1 hypothetical protein GSVR_09450 [Geobacter sp. SVR]GCF83926.1 hypothetical protein GSbR_05260 [Geobacter sp. SVR]